MPALSVGVEDTVPATYLSPLHNKIREAFRRGDMETAHEYQVNAPDVHLFCSLTLVSLASLFQYKLMVMTSARSKYVGNSGPFTATRAVMAMLGVDLGPPRLPFQQLSAQDYTALESDLKSIGFFDWVK